MRVDHDDADDLWLDLERARDEIERSMARVNSRQMTVALRRYVRRQPARYFSAAALAGLYLALVLPR